jgi:hypothetical protein
VTLPACVTDITDTTDIPGNMQTHSLQRRYYRDSQRLHAQSSTPSWGITDIAIIKPGMDITDIIVIKTIMDTTDITVIKVTVNSINTKVITEIKDAAT